MWERALSEDETPHLHTPRSVGTAARTSPFRGTRTRGDANGSHAGASAALELPVSAALPVRTGRGVKPRGRRDGVSDPGHRDTGEACDRASDHTGSKSL